MFVVASGSHCSACQVQHPELVVLLVLELLLLLLLLFLVPCAVA
jgi:hypothetical protein